MRFLPWILIFLLLACGRSYKPDSHLSVQKQDEIMWKIIRYLAKPPEGLTRPERFYKGYDPYYQEQKSRHLLEAYFVSEGIHYFLISRQAPSLVEKRVATGGKLRLDANGKLVEYEEVFRTWKMIPDTLMRRSLLLFDKMVKGESLTPYYTANSKGIDYIEFPDNVNYYDKSLRSWEQK